MTDHSDGHADPTHGRPAVIPWGRLLVHILFVLVTAGAVRAFVLALFPSAMRIAHLDMLGRSPLMALSLFLALAARRLLDRFYPVATNGRSSK